MSRSTSKSALGAMLFVPCLLLTACGEGGGEARPAAESEQALAPPGAPVRQGYAWSAARGRLVPVSYAVVEGLAVAEGDMVLGTVEEVEARTRQVEAQGGPEAAGVRAQGVSISGAFYRWPNALVPYAIDAALPNQARVTDAINHWQQRTHIRFVLRTAANAAQYPDYVLFRPGSGCSSYVGKIGGSQAVTLESACSTGNTIHEIGHALGLWHEQSREDRNSYVRIRFENITPGYEHNFNQHITDGDDLLGYDFGSIMHYPATAFSSNGLPTIETLGGQSIGQRSALSATDAASAERIYARPISLRTSGGYYLVAEYGGGNVVNANRTAVGPWELFHLVDLNGGALVSGDSVYLQVFNGNYVVAENGGNGVVNANRAAPAGWETFRVWRLAGGGTISSGEGVALQSSGGYYVVAENGGNSAVNANRTAIGAWESFTLTFH